MERELAYSRQSLKSTTSATRKIPPPIRPYSNAIRPQRSPGDPDQRSLAYCDLPRANHETKIAQQYTAMDGESREEWDARIKALWEQLDTKKKGNVDLPALKNGLVKMNHRESGCRDERDRR
jgi:hypothetical protein